MHGPPVFLEVPFGTIEPWNKNPRNIKTKMLEELAESIKTKFLFQSLTAWPIGEKYEDYPNKDTGQRQVGGGNMRWQAMKHILNYGDDFLITIGLSFPENEAERIELSILDNMPFGQYDIQAVAELAVPHIEVPKLESLKLNIDEPIDLKNIIEQFGPNLDGRADGLSKHLITCPFCGEEFMKGKSKKQDNG